MRLVVRLSAYCTRFAIASQNLGLPAALRVFVWMRSGSRLRSLHLARLGRSVFFRSAADKGAISHLFQPGVRILDTPATPVRIIVDAGANIGLETIRMRYFHPQARILAIEPDAGNYAVLEKNAAAQPGFIETLRAGVWSQPGPLRILPGPTNEGFSVCPAAEGETASIQAITMNAVLARMGGEIDILKMDMEGAEFQVFRENTEWTHHVKAIIMECPDNDRPGATSQVFRTLGHLPFNTYISGENLVMIRRDTAWKMETTPYL